MWRYYAVFSALFAGLTAILAKMGLKGISGNLATAVRTTVVLFMAWGIVLAMGQWKELKTLTKYNLLFLVLSGIATGLSWIFYFKALETGACFQGGAYRQTECGHCHWPFGSHLKRIGGLENAYGSGIDHCGDNCADQIKSRITCRFFMH